MHKRPPPLMLSGVSHFHRPDGCKRSCRAALSRRDGKSLGTKRRRDKKKKQNEWHGRAAHSKPAAGKTTASDTTPVGCGPLPIRGWDSHCLELAARVDQHLGVRAIARPRRRPLNALDDVVPVRDGAKDGVLPIQPRARHGGDEELRAVGVRPGVGHRQQPNGSVGEVEVLICKLLAIDGLAARAVAVGEVTAPVETQQSIEGGRSTSL